MSMAGAQESEGSGGDVGTAEENKKRHKAENSEIVGWGKRREVGRVGSNRKLAQKKSQIKGCRKDCGTLINLS